MVAEVTHARASISCWAVCRCTCSEPAFGLRAVAIALTSGLALRDPDASLRDRKLDACLLEVDRIALGTRAWFRRPAQRVRRGPRTAGRWCHVHSGRGHVAAHGRHRRTREIVTAYGAAAVPQMATTFSLPVLALPAILGDAAINHSLETAAYLGAAVLVTLLAMLVVLAYVAGAPGAAALHSRRPRLRRGLADRARGD